jgi:hypothetical protein
VPVLELPEDVLTPCPYNAANAASTDPVRQIQLTIVELTRVGDCANAKIETTAEIYFENVR